MILPAQRQTRWFSSKGSSTEKKKAPGLRGFFISSIFNESGFNIDHDVFEPGGGHFMGEVHGLSGLAFPAVEGAVIGPFPLVADCLKH